MVVELGVGRPKVAVPGGADLQAEVDVVERHLQLLGLEPADLQVNLAPDDQARGGHRRQILLQQIAVRLAGRAAGVRLPRVRGDAADAEDDAGVLDAVVGIVELRADTADLGAQRVRYHLVEPVAVDDLEVVVQQADQRGVGLAHAKIVDRGVIEFAGERHHAHAARIRLASARALGRELREVGERLRLVAVIVDDQDLEVRVRGLGEQTLHARLEDVEAVARRDDQRHARRRVGERVVDAPVRALGRRDGRGDADADEMLADDLLRGLRGVALRADEHRGRAGHAAPVVENLRDVPDAVAGGALDDAHREVPVLRALVADAESADIADEQRAVHAEVADVILDEEQVRVPVGLEVLVVAVAVLVDLVLVAVDDVGVRVRLEFEGDAGEGVRAEFVVVVEQRDELAVREGEGGIRRGGDVAVGFAQDEFDARILLLVTLEDLADVRLLRGVVGDAEFPVVVELAADGLDGGDEPLLRRVVRRHQHRDQRTPGEGREFGADFLGALRRKAVVGGDPRGVGVRRRRRGVGRAFDLAGHGEVPGAGFVLRLDAQQVRAVARDVDLDDPAAALGAGVVAEVVEHVEPFEAEFGGYALAVERGADRPQRHAAAVKGPATHVQRRGDVRPVLRVVDVAEQLRGGGGRGGFVEEFAAQRPERRRDLPREGPLHYGDFFVARTHHGFDLGKPVGGDGELGGVRGAELILGLALGDAELRDRLNAGGGFRARSCKGGLGAGKVVFECDDLGVGGEERVFVGGDLQAAGAEQDLGLLAALLMFLGFLRDVVGVGLRHRTGLLEAGGVLARGGEEVLDVFDVLLGQLFAGEDGVAIGGGGADALAGGGFDRLLELADDVGEEVGRGSELAGGGIVEGGGCGVQLTGEGGGEERGVGRGGVLRE